MPVSKQYFTQHGQKCVGIFFSSRKDNKIVKNKTVPAQINKQQELDIDKELSSMFYTACLELFAKIIIVLGGSRSFILDISSSSIYLCPIIFLVMI